MTRTKIRGYVNLNPWPVQISISERNSTFTVDPKCYVVDRDGRKINDPILEPLAKEGHLSAEKVDVELPIVYLGSVQTESNQPKSNSPTVVGSSSNIVDAAAKVDDNRWSPVTAMSMDEARKLGLVKGSIPDDSSDSGQRDAEPKDRHLKRPAQVPPAPVAQKPTARNEARPEAIQQPVRAKAVNLDFEERPSRTSAAAIKAADSQLKEERLLSQGSSTDEREKALLRALKIGDTAEPDEPDLPPPVLDDSGQLDFFCQENGKSFRSYGALMRHVQKNYPDKVDHYSKLYAPSNTPEV